MDKEAYLYVDEAAFEFLMTGLPAAVPEGEEEDVLDGLYDANDPGPGALSLIAYCLGLTKKHLKAIVGAVDTITTNGGFIQVPPVEYPILAKAVVGVISPSMLTNWRPFYRVSNLSGDRRAVEFILEMQKSDETFARWLTREHAERKAAKKVPNARRKKVPNARRKKKKSAAAKEKEAA